MDDLTSMTAVRMLIVFVATYGLCLFGPFSLPARALGDSCGTDCASAIGDAAADTTGVSPPEHDVSQFDRGRVVSKDDEAGIPPWIVGAAGLGIAVSVAEFALSSRRNRISNSQDR